MQGNSSDPNNKYASSFSIGYFLALAGLSTVVGDNYAIKVYSDRAVHDCRTQEGAVGLLLASPAFSEAAKRGYEIFKGSGALRYMDEPTKDGRYWIGTHYDITNHDMALVGRNTIHVGVNLDADGFAEYTTPCSIMHITKVEYLSETTVQ